jgi:hypothetical protein
MPVPVYAGREKVREQRRLARRISGEQEEVVAKPLERRESAKCETPLHINVPAVHGEALKPKHGIATRHLAVTWLSGLRCREDDGLACSSSK